MPDGRCILTLCLRTPTTVLKPLSHAFKTSSLAETNPYEHSATRRQTSFRVMAEGKRRLWPVAQLLLLGIIFHLVFIGTVFDCYFTSPVVHGMKAYGQLEDLSKAPAKRLVLIVGTFSPQDACYNMLSSLA